MLSLCSPRVFRVLALLTSYLLVSLEVQGAFKDPLFRINEEPGVKDWRYFMQLPEPEKDSLWVHFTKEKKQLKDWSWSWRMAWVKSCRTGSNTRCHPILNQALVDEALVVRTEAVKVVGERFQQSKSKVVAKALYTVFKNKGNYHHGVPLQIQQNILFSLHQVGGPEALTTARKLAATDPTLKTYWAKLQRVKTP